MHEDGCVAKVAEHGGTHSSRKTMRKNAKKCETPPNNRKQHQNDHKTASLYIFVPKIWFRSEFE